MITRLCRLQIDTLIKEKEVIKNHINTEHINYINIYNTFLNS